MAVREEIRLVLLFVWLICSGNSINWQGTGNMSQSNMTFIWNYIKNNFNKSKTNSEVANADRNYLSDFAESFSNALNSQWDRAWNVFVMYHGQSNYDVVVYGYAFRDHWMWYNGYQMIDGYYISFIIWKDYNCQTWKTFNTILSGATTLEYTMFNTFRGIVSDSRSAIDLDKDLWSVAQLYVKNMESAYSGNAFTVIVTKASQVLVFARFCSVSYGNTWVLDNSSNGMAFLMQMR